jgi:hypothetical protein
MTATHRWTTVSSHHTSEGPVRYQRCGCGAWRVLAAGADARPSEWRPSITR